MESTKASDSITKAKNQMAIVKMGSIGQCADQTETSWTCDSGDWTTRAYAGQAGHDEPASQHPVFSITTSLLPMQQLITRVLTFFNQKAFIILYFNAVVCIVWLK